MFLMNSSNKLNLAHYQQKIDEIIFDYIDSSPNWDKASNYLDEILEQTISFFNEAVEKEGKLPSANTFWVLFTDLNAKLLYFATLALKNKSQRSIGITDEILAKRFEIAAKCITNIDSEESQLFLDEIEASYNETSNEQPFAGREARTPSQSIQTFYEFTKAY